MVVHHPSSEAKKKYADKKKKIFIILMIIFIMLLMAITFTTPHKAGSRFDTIRGIPFFGLITKSAAAIAGPFRAIS